jgi:hypothetical protein
MWCFCSRFEIASACFQPFFDKGVARPSRPTCPGSPPSRGERGRASCLAGEASVTLGELSDDQQQHDGGRDPEHARCDGETELVRQSLGDVLVVLPTRR